MSAKNEAGGISMFTVVHKADNSSRCAVLHHISTGIRDAQKQTASPIHACPVTSWPDICFAFRPHYHVDSCRETRKRFAQAKVR